MTKKHKKRQKWYNVFKKVLFIAQLIKVKKFIEIIWG